MAAHTIDTADGEAAVGATLAANTTDTITFDKDCSAVEIAADGSDVLFYTVDGSAPDITGASKNNRLPATGGWNSVVVEVPTAGDTVVKLKAATGVEFLVSEAR